MVSLSAVDGNSSVSQRWLGISLYHPSSTGSHCRFSEAFHYPLPAMYKSVMQRDMCERTQKTHEYQQRKCTHTHTHIHPRLPHHTKHPAIPASLKSHINPHTPHTNIQWGMAVPPSNSGGHQCPVKVLTEWLGQHVLLSTPH